MDRVLAIVGLRFRLQTRRLRGGSDVARIAGSVLTYLLGAALALGLAVGFGFLTHVTVASGDEASCRVGFLIAFYTFFFFGVVMPLITGTTSQGFNVSPLRIFPIGRGKLYGLTLCAYAGSSEHLLYYPALLAVCLFGILLTGIDPGLGLLTIALLLSFYVTAGNGILLFLAGIMRQRRMREIIAIVAFMLLIAVAVAPSAIYPPDQPAGEESVGPSVALLLRIVVAVGEVLPPSLAAEALTALRMSRPDAALARMALLSAWCATCLVLGYGAFLRYHLGGADSAGAPGRSRARPAAAAGPSKPRELLSADNPLFASIPVPIRAVAAKELLYILRSVIGKFNLLMLPVFVIIVVFLIARHLDSSLFGIPVDGVVLMGLLLYAALFSNNFVNNAFAWEGAGIRAYFLAPLKPSHVLAGKNLAVWTYNTAMLFIALLSWFFLKGIPEPMTLITAILLYAAAILSFTTVGNLVSVLFPVRRDISSITNSPSQIAILLSLASLGAAVSIITSVLFLAHLLGLAYLQPLFLVVLLGLLAGAYALVLGFAGRLMERRKEQLIDRLGAMD